MNVRKMLCDEAEKRKISIRQLCLLAEVPSDGIFRYLRNEDNDMHSKPILKMIKFCGYQFKKGK